MYKILNPVLANSLLLCELVQRPATVELVKISVETPGHVDHILQVRVRQCKILSLGVLPCCRNGIPHLSAVHFLELYFLQMLTKIWDVDRWVPELLLRTHPAIPRPGSEVL